MIGYTVETRRDLAEVVEDALGMEYCAVKDIRRKGSMVMFDVSTDEWDSAETLQGWLRDDVQSDYIWVC